MKKHSKDKNKTASNKRRATPLAINQFVFNQVVHPGIVFGCTCTHGAKAAHMVAIEYLSTFCKHVESDGLQGMDRVHSQMIDAMKKYGLKHVPLDTIKGLLALVTNLLLSRLAKLVAVFESCDLSLGMAAVANAINMQNYTGYSGKTQLALYAKRISCQCFDGLVAHIMTCSMKIESVYCEYCCIEFPSTVLFKCSQCRSVQYCSKICQRKHWPQHENYCAFVDQMKKTSQQTTTTP